MQVVAGLEDDRRKENEEEGGGGECFFFLPICDVLVGHEVDDEAD